MLFLLLLVIGIVLVHDGVAVVDHADVVFCCCIVCCLHAAVEFFFIATFALCCHCVVTFRYI